MGRRREGEREREILFVLSLEDTDHLILSRPWTEPCPLYKAKKKNNDQKKKKKDGEKANIFMTLPKSIHLLATDGRFLSYVSLFA